MSELRQRERKGDGLKPAFERLTNGVSTLVKQHIELARHEIEHDVKTNGTRAAVVAACGVVALVGWGLLNAAGIMFAAWLGGMLAGWIVAAALAVVHLAAAAGAGLYFGNKLREDKPVDLAQTNDELDRDKLWLRAIGEDRKNGRRKSETPARLSRDQLPPS